MLQSFLITFAEYTLDVLPYFFLASLFGATLQSLGGTTFISSKVINSRYGPIVTAGIGAFVPLCSCSMIPIARTINSFSRESYAPVLSFLVTAPVISPVVIILTFGVFGLEITMLRIIYALLFAFLLSILAHLFFKKNEILPLIQEGPREDKYIKKKFEIFFSSFKDLFLSTGKYILIGLLIASLIKVLIPQNLIVSFSSQPFSYPLIAFISVPIYVCSGEEVPIAKAFYDLGLTRGQVLTFMLASTGICIPTVTALMTFMPRSIISLYVGAWLLVSILLGLFTDVILN